MDENVKLEKNNEQEPLPEMKIIEVKEFEALKSQNEALEARLEKAKSVYKEQKEKIEKLAEELTALSVDNALLKTENDKYRKFVETLKDKLAGFEEL